MMNAGRNVELPDDWLDGHLSGWLGGKHQQGLGQARERGADVVLGEHAGGL
jgi:hypothetical protein